MSRKRSRTETHDDDIVIELLDKNSKQTNNTNNINAEVVKYITETTDYAERQARKAIIAAANCEALKISNLELKAAFEEVCEEKRYYQNQTSNLNEAVQKEIKRSAASRTTHQEEAKKLSDKIIAENRDWISKARNR